MPAHAPTVYVEIDIRAPIERVWELTQTPELHERWDLRFTEIRYLPRPDPAEPQCFLYATRIGLGLEIRGEGETAGSHDAAGGQRTSALKFWSDDPKSLIREGSGYWKYVPCEDGGAGVRFLTAYDYAVRFGAAGRLIDRLVFRPMIGWATAWSFDRLRLWAERGIDPAVSMRRSLTNAVARLALAFVWVYQGLVPKLVYRHPDELAMLGRAGLSGEAARTLNLWIGAAEVALGLALLLAWRARWPLWLTVIAMPLATLAVAIRAPAHLVTPFNATTLNACVFALALIGLIGGGDNLPSANRCLRHPPREEA